MKTRYRGADRIWIVIFLVILMPFSIIGFPKSGENGQVDGLTSLDPTKVICTNETTETCQRCAKKTESPVVYPWCCANYEDTYEWCIQYLNFGLP